MENWLTDNSGVIESAVNIGLIKQNEGIYLVDTGIDNSAVNKVRKTLDLDIIGALVTHHHADHMGGCSKLEKLGIENIYGPDKELPFIHDTVLEPYTMFGGAYPPELLRNRHLEARSALSVLSTSEQDVVEVVSTPGHTIDHQAFLYDDTIFTGDSAFTQETIDKYKILFAVNPREAANSIDTLLDIEFDQMIPGHGPVQTSRSDSIEVLQATKKHYLSTMNKILSAIGEKLSYGKYIDKMLDYFDLQQIVKDRGFLQYILYQVPLQGYLTNLVDSDELVIETTSSGAVIRAL